MGNQSATPTVLGPSEIQSQIDNDMATIDGEAERFLQKKVATTISPIPELRPGMEPTSLKPHLQTKRQHVVICCMCHLH
jgi:hypothetical protein